MADRMVTAFAEGGDKYVLASVNAQKKLQRNILKERLKTLDENYINEASHTIVEKIINLKEYQEAETVFCYINMGKEVITEEIIKDALGRGKRLGIPLTTNDNEMVVKRYRGEHLKEGRFGIKEPDFDFETIPKEQIKLAIIPSLSCDRKGGRLGHGKGYYDKYMEGTDFIKIAPAFEKMLLNKIVTYTKDIIMDMVITEKDEYSGENYIFLP